MASWHFLQKVAGRIKHDNAYKIPGQCLTHDKFSKNTSWIEFCSARHTAMLPRPLLKKGMLPGYWKCSQQRASNCQQLRVHLSCRKLPHGACALPETVWIQRPRKGFKGLAIWALMWDILTSSSLYCLSLGQAYISELLPTSVPHLASSFHRYWPLHILHSKLYLSVCSWRTQSATFVHISQNHT